MTVQDQIGRARAELLAAQKELVNQLSDDKSRTRGALMRQLHVVRGMLSQSYAYQSQAGQDMVIDTYFKHKRGGTFIDIGAYDGVTGSNTYFFETIRGWSGVLVEPMPAQRAKAAQNRNSPILEYAVSDQDGEAEFIAVTQGFTQMSGLANTYDAKMLERVRADDRHEETTIKVATRPLTAILQEAEIPNPDFISLDVEGGELAALENFSFSEHDVGAWAIENNTGDPALPALMRDNGYRLIEFCGPDEIYVKAE